MHVKRIGIDLAKQVFHLSTLMGMKWLKAPCCCFRFNSRSISAGAPTTCRDKRTQQFMGDNRSRIYFSNAISIH